MILDRIIGEFDYNNIIFLWIQNLSGDQVLSR